jgi:hypothetical protein
MAEHDSMSERRGLPTERDFDPAGRGLDEQHAWRNFGGLTLEEANKKFRECPETYQEDFMWMGERAFVFYFPVIESYLKETTARDEGDDRQAWILAYCIKQQFTGTSGPDLMRLAPRVLDLAEFVRMNLQLFASQADEQRRIDIAWQHLKEHTESVIGVKASGDAVRKQHWMMLLILVLVLGGGLWLWRRGSPAEAHPFKYDRGQKSSELSADIGRMWETKPLGGRPDPTHGPYPRSSTDRAINAASRVFNAAELKGKSSDDVVALLGDPKSSSDSIYNFPFWPAPEGALVYRFDSGSYGWQFNVAFGDDGRVREVERHWIH